METKLLPCPFCPDGGEPKISRYSYELEYGAHVYCRRCNTSGPEIHESMPLEDVEVLAIEAWNTRHEKTCDGCKHLATSMRVDYHIDPCCECVRNAPDLYEPKEANDAD